MRVQKRAARRRREARRVNIEGIWCFVGKTVRVETGSGLGSAGAVVFSGGEDVEGPEGFSLSKIGKGEDAASTAGIHCSATFFSTSTTLKAMSKTINPKAM